MEESLDELTEVDKQSVTSIINYVENRKSEIRKNYNDMDLVNSDLNNKFENVVKSMESKCDELINKLKLINS